MAISYGGQLFESTSTVQMNAKALGSTIAAGSLIAVIVGGKRSGTALNVNAVTDSHGHTWSKVI
jgi:hypothetical protein